MKSCRLRKGFTLIEVLISFSVLLAVWLCVLGAAVANRKITSYSKHKIQAIYLAQQKIEELRLTPFSSITSIPSPGENIIIDDMATAATADNIMGRRIVTVTSIDTYRKRVQIEVNWTEPALGTSGTRREYCTTVIANEPTIN